MVPGGLVRSCPSGLTMALVATGQLAEAERSCARGLAMARQAGTVSSQCDFLIELAGLDLLAGRIAEARAHLREELELAGPVSDPVFLLDCLDLCGLLCARMQRWADAVTAWAALAVLQQDTGVPDPPHDAQRRNTVYLSYLRTGRKKTRRFSRAGRCPTHPRVPGIRRRCPGPRPASGRPPRQALQSRPAIASQLCSGPNQW
jgi:hypothetical protein